MRNDLALLFYRRRTDGSSVPRITLSGLTVAEDAEVNDVIGTLDVANATGPWTFTIDDDPSGLFDIDGADLIVADALTPGTYPVTISAADGTPVPSPRVFNIVVTEVVEPVGDSLLNFSTGGVSFLHLGMI